MPYTPLVDALSTPALGGIDGTLARPIMTELLRDRPVSITGLAQNLGLTPEETARRLGTMPETEFDDAGNIQGYVLTRAETPHRFRVCETQLFTWCPLDTLIVPQLIGATAHVEGNCGRSGERVSFISAPKGTYGESHPNITISLPRPDDLTRLRSAFCQKVRFFTSPEAANDWLGPKHDCDVLPLHEAQDLSRTLADRLHAGQETFATAV